MFALKDWSFSWKYTISVKNVSVATNVVCCFEALEFLLEIHRHNLFPQQQVLTAKAGIIFQNVLSQHSVLHMQV